jgi:hypothetical protein
VQNVEGISSALDARSQNWKKRRMALSGISKPAVTVLTSPTKPATDNATECRLTLYH